MSTYSYPIHILKQMRTEKERAEQARKATSTTSTVLTAHMFRSHPSVPAVEADLVEAAGANLGHPTNRRTPNKETWAAVPSIAPSPAPETTVSVQPHLVGKEP